MSLQRDPSRDPLRPPPQETLGELCSPRRVWQSARTNPSIPAMMQPSAHTPDGATQQRLASRTHMRPAQCRGIAVIIGLALQLLSCVHGVLPAWGQAGQAASEIKRPEYQIRRFDED
jgi:hypothetical protein